MPWNDTGSHPVVQANFHEMIEEHFKSKGYWKDPSTAVPAFPQRSGLRLRSKAHRTGPRIRPQDKGHRVVEVCSWHLPEVMDPWELGMPEALRPSQSLAF